MAHLYFMWHVRKSLNHSHVADEGFCLLYLGFYLFIHIKGSTSLSETDFCKIMEFLADYLKMIKLYEKIFYDSGMY